MHITQDTETRPEHPYIRMGYILQTCSGAFCGSQSPPAVAPPITCSTDWCHT